MDNKPLVTYQGDVKLFASLRDAIVQGLPQECVEWRRSYGRTPKSVCVEVSFLPFSEQILPSDEEMRNLLGHPFLHTFWIECNDVEKYRGVLKTSIDDWMSILKEKNIQDWMIIVVEHQDNKKVNKTKLGLSRTSIAEKIRSDFHSKNGERCISLLDPFRSDSRAAESWNALLQRLRQLLLQAYSCQLNWYEEHIRAQREKRNEPGWNFLDFFFQQEELAFVFEMLGVFDDALVQYDELDALFSQFVINSSSGDIPDWLSVFSKTCDTWQGICLPRENISFLRTKLYERQGSLLDLRSYLFARQCLLLLMLCRPWEMAHRSLQFLHNCISELRILEIILLPGTEATWVFLSCLEILQTCERFSDSGQVETYSLYTVELWAYVREKLRELGILCGLMPDMTATSDQLHQVVSLLSGMGKDPYDEDRQPSSPQSRLREALSSKDAFLRHYLEISELTMGTFKHIGRFRSARLIGKDLAELYMKMGEPEKAVGFLTDLLQIYYRDNWNRLIGKTQMDLLACYKALGDKQKYMKTCVRIAANNTVETKLRLSSWKQVVDIKQELPPTVLIKTDRIFSVLLSHFICADKIITTESEVQLLLIVQSMLPLPIELNEIKISLSKQPCPLGNEQILHPSAVKLTKSHHLSSMSEENPHKIAPPLDLVIHCETTTKGIHISRLKCQNAHQVLSRRDSHNTALHRETEITEADYTLSFSDQNISIDNGVNQLTLKKTGLDTGTYQLSQLCLVWDNIHFVYYYPPLAPSFTILFESPKINLQAPNGPLSVGVPQRLELVVSSGSSQIDAGIQVMLKPSQGLTLKLEDGWSHEADISLPRIPLFSSIRLPIEVFAEFGPQRDASMIAHRVVLRWPLSDSPFSVPLHFLPPFLTEHKLHTCNEKKYVQVSVHGATSTVYALKRATLNVLDSPEVVLTPLNSPSQVLVTSSDQTALFLWEYSFPKNDPSSSEPRRFVFSIDYRPQSGQNEKFHTYNYKFKLSNYRTLFSVSATVEPPNGSEFCRAGSMCHMKITITRLNPDTNFSLMYEVFADPSMWSVCGKVAGVVILKDNEPFASVFDVMPLVGGFLPLPTVRISKYIETEQVKMPGMEASNTARLQPFEPGQVYNWSRALQAHVLPATSMLSTEADLN